MNITIKPFGSVNPKVREHRCEELHDMAEVSLSAPPTVPDSFVRRNRDGQDQYLATEFEKAMAPEKGDRVLAVTDVDLFDHGLNFVFGHATIRDRFAVISIARFGSDGPEKLLERSAKTAMHALGHTLGVYHDDSNRDCFIRLYAKLQ